MLPKINRLTKKKDFDAVFKEGESIKKSFLVFKILKNNSGKTRIGFVVSKKVSNKAALRNKIKRRLRVAVFGEIKEGCSIKSADIVIVALPGVKNEEFLKIRETIHKVLIF